MPLKNKEAKAAYMKEYRAKNRDKMNAAKRRYYQRNKKRIAKQRKDYYKRNQKHMKKVALSYYYNNKEHCKDRHKKYAAKHRPQINEWSRANYYKKQGRKVPKKPFSFYRDYIKLVNKLPDAERSKIFNSILKLPLTKQQRELVQLTYQGYKQKEIAKLLNISQGAVCQIWNGWQSKTGIFYGGIYKKVCKATNGKRQPKRQVSVQNLGSSVLGGAVE